MPDAKAEEHGPESFDPARCHRNTGKHYEFAFEQKRQSDRRTRKPIHESGAGQQCRTDRSDFPVLRYGRACVGL